ncbi:hypothetical protein PTTG_12079 [Puccinia triticina 1-1 BBBD Race 1]|uniref:HEME_HALOPEROXIDASE domain-containing protein n=2 Tax=Puccinia triticina TaxID=208348 RepID=A0A180GR97_PUCT1|nr:uncharacterized protein PtA15_3A537 [Puccinia triticina]OAV95346.1 hypothetical protein PTTG_12079 [Puccinia triticina 1-1 BBBD Race 1]WAQ83169.1 hypothetical protein PtA15_3A537 [Puccinia triticina]WAR54010.1 hypothetical protein PtB15_3B520 [Puccinia triticina]
MRCIFSQADPLPQGVEGEAMGIKSTPEEEHAYSQRTMGCPCPAMSAMINHSYLKPCDDEDSLPFFQVVQALRKCYNFSFPFAFIFVLATNVRLGTILTWRFTLKQIKKHGVIEHDASISRYNSSEGDYLNPQGELVDNFIDGIHYPPGLESAEKMITLEDFAKKRVELEDRLTSFLFLQPKFWIHLLGIGEAAMTLRAFADKSSPLYARDMCVRADWLRIWLKEERFPLELGWENRRDGYKITLFGIFRTIWKLYRATNAIKNEKSINQ